MHYSVSMPFRENLRAEMEYKGITAKELAAKAGISINTLNMYLGYRKSMPSADVAAKLANALGVSIEHLLQNTSYIDNSVAERELFVSAPLRLPVRFMEGLPPDSAPVDPEKERTALKKVITKEISTLPAGDLKLLIDIIAAVKKNAE